MLVYVNQWQVWHNYRGITCMRLYSTEEAMNKDKQFIKADGAVSSTAWGCTIQEIAHIIIFNEAISCLELTWDQMDELRTWCWHYQKKKRDMFPF